MKKFWTLSLLTSLCLSFAPVQADEAPQMNLQRITLSAGIHQIDTQLAVTSAQQATGLMYRNEMPQNEGMLFVFEQATVQCFWMKNTLIPLSIGFIDEQGILVQVEDMAPNTLTTHCAKTAIKYAIEMNKGWYAKNKANIGMPLLETQKP